MLILLILLSLMISASSLLFLAVNPLSMSIIILSLSLLLSMLYSSILSSWIAFLIFLIYIGGMLVMFAYFVALIPNQPMNMALMIPMLISSTTMLTILYLFQMHPILTMFFNKLTNILYLKANIPILLILALALLLTMIIVVKLVTNNKGPLRPFIKYV